MVFALPLFSTVIYADGHCQPFWCLGRVIYSEWCKNNLDLRRSIWRYAIHRVLACTTVHTILAPERHVFLTYTIVQLTINLAVRESGGSLTMIFGQGIQRALVSKQHVRRVPLPSR